MRLPTNPDNWSIHHVEKAILEARKLFAEYERRVDFNNRDKTDNLYRKYQIARQTAIDVSNSVGVKDLIKEAESLP